MLRKVLQCGGATLFREMEPVVFASAKSHVPSRVTTTANTCAGNVYSTRIIKTKNKKISPAPPTFNLFNNKELQSILTEAELQATKHEAGAKVTPENK
jgi:hypothetical protein